MNKIMVVDDEESLVRLITYNLQKDGYETIHAYEGSKVIQILRKEKPDLLILDLMLPGKSGLEICQEIRRMGDRIPIIMLTARDEELDRVLGLEMGADDYVTKPFSVRELSARVKAVLRRNRPEPGKLDSEKDFIAGPFIIKTESYEIFQNGKPLDLTLKEFELLDILIRNRGRVLKRDYLLELLWGYSESLNSRVLDVHVSKLRDKIEEDSKNPKYIKTIRGLGYKLEI
jgi:two-component system alkaline phosphatase synthesis response regulator PhoP